MRALIAILLLLAAPAAAQTYGVAVIGSQHIGDGGELNDFNPGLGFGRRFDGPWGLEANVEGGIFYNSYEEIAPYALYGLSAEVARLGDVGLRLGAFAGLFYYDELSRILEEDLGYPNVGGVIPLAGLTASARLPTGTDVRLSALPPGDGVDAIFNLSIAQEF